MSEASPIPAIAKPLPAAGSSSADVQTSNSRVPDTISDPPIKDAMISTNAQLDSREATASESAQNPVGGGRSVEAEDTVATEHSKT